MCGNPRRTKFATMWKAKSGNTLWQIERHNWALPKSLSLMTTWDDRAVERTNGQDSVVCWHRSVRVWLGRVRPGGFSLGPQQSRLASPSRSELQQPSAGISGIRTSYRSPGRNGVAERRVRRFRNKLLDHVLHETHQYSSRRSPPWLFLGKAA